MLEDFAVFLFSVDYAISIPYKVRMSRKKRGDNRPLVSRFPVYLCFKYFLRFIVSQIRDERDSGFFLGFAISREYVSAAYSTQ